MKLSFLHPARPAGMLAFALIACVVALVAFAPDAHAASLTVASEGINYGLSHLGMASALVALRAKVTDLETRVAAKQAELVEGLAQDAARAIELAHAGLVGELKAAREAVTAAEAAERAAPAPTPNPAPAPAPANEDAIRQAERTRQTEIRALGASARMAPADIEAACNANTSVEDFRVRAFQVMAARDDATMTRSAQFGGQDADDTRRAGMTAAIAARMARAGGERNVQIPEHARAYGEMGLVEIAAECVGHRGNIRTGRQVVEVFERAFNTVSDFPAIFVDALNVRLLARYQLANPTYRQFAAPYTSTDFKPTYVVRAGDFPALQPLGETGEIKSGSWSESKEVLKVDPYAVMVNISRQMMINDQLGAIDQMLGSTGERVTDWENAKVFALLASNPVLLTDNKRVFHADHGNLAVSGSAIGVDSVSAVRAAMKKQKTLDGLKANFAPKTILVGPDGETKVEQLLAAITPAQVGFAVPESFRKLQPVSDANIEGTEWYGFADPSVAPCFLYGYLEGFEGPRLTSEQVFNLQGMRVKLEHDVGAAAIDFRGGYKNPGA